MQRAGAGQLEALNSTLGTMQRLLAFADPELCLHFRQLELTVNMFAVPWFITLFSHLLPIPDIYIVWDALIVGPPLLPVFIACSILRRLRSQLLLAASVDDALVILTQVLSPLHRIGFLPIGTGLAHPSLLVLAFCFSFIAPPPLHISILLVRGRYEDTKPVILVTHVWNSSSPNVVRTELSVQTHSCLPLVTSAEFFRSSTSQRS